MKNLPQHTLPNFSKEPVVSDLWGWAEMDQGVCMTKGNIVWWDCYGGNFWSLNSTSLSTFWIKDIRKPVLNLRPISVSKMPFEEFIEPQIKAKPVSLLNFISLIFITLPWKRLEISINIWLTCYHLSANQKLLSTCLSDYSKYPRFRAGRVLILLALNLH